jgi:probable rRNA maturation factor
MEHSFFGQFRLGKNNASLHRQPDSALPIFSLGRDDRFLAMYQSGFLPGWRGAEVVILERRVPDLTELALARFVDRARKAAGLKGSVNVLVTSDAEMKALNGRFRGKNRATDVLSFSVSVEDGRGKALAGEIAISADIARRNAQALGHGAAQEVKILALHGVLHLGGYDHETDDGEMARREAELRAQLRLPVGLIERGSAKKLLKTSFRARQFPTAAKAVSGFTATKARPFKATEGSRSRRSARRRAARTVEWRKT